MKKAFLIIAALSSGAVMAQEPAQDTPAAPIQAASAPDLRVLQEQAQQAAQRVEEAAASTPEAPTDAASAPALVVPAPLVAEQRTSSAAPAKRRVPAPVSTGGGIKHDAIDGFKYPSARAAAEKSTRWANSRGAIGRGQDGRVVAIYGQSVPKIACAYLRVCSIELEPGETVTKVDAGDPVRWSITPSIVGEGAQKTVHVVIKPKSDEPGLYTNLKIATNRRMYDIDIFSVTGEKFVRRLAFTYPENEAAKWEAQRVAMQQDSTVATLPALGVDSLNFHYSIEGNFAHRPVRVFDDTYKTYIQMGPDFRVQEAPVLVLIDRDGKEKLVNYRLKNGYFVVDKLFERAALLVGVGRSQQKVVITRNCQPGIFGSCAQPARSSNPFVNTVY